jgi:hypothetical protein
VSALRLRRISLRGFAQNWRLKLAALALAVLLWAVVSAEQVTTQWIPVRVEPVVRDPGYVLTGGPEPAEVRVRFTGAGRELWELALDRPTLVLPVRNVGDARSFVLDPQMVRLPDGLRVTPQDVRPAVVRLELQRVVTREVPVRAVVGERSREAYVLEDTVRVSPSTVEVTGPRGAVERLEAVPTRIFEVVPEDGAFSRQVSLDTAGLPSGLSLSNREVRVSGRVDRRVERAFPAVAVQAPAGLAAAPGEVEVRVRGAEGRVRALFPANLRATVARDSLPAAVPLEGVEAPVEVDGVPPGMTVTAVPARVRVAPAAVAPPLPAAGAPDSPAPRPAPPR